LISIEAPPSSPNHPTPARRAIQLTTANLHNNKPFGDFMDEKADGTFCIWGNNFNGLSIDNLGGDFMELCEEATTMQADIVAGTKHNLDTRQYYVQKNWYETCMKNRKVGHYKLQMSSTPILAATLYKPGGTLLLAQGNCVAQIIEGGNNDMG
jgi:hypothetical protein